MPGTAVNKVFCTTREAAELLDVAVSTVQVWVETGVLQAWKTAGGHRRVLRESVDALLHPRRGQVSGPREGIAVDNGTTLTLTRPLRVMVVEDDEALLRLYRVKIGAWPQKVDLTTMDNAVSALIGMGRVVPDLLVTDLNMPGLDGFNMLRVLRQMPEMAKTAVAVVTGLDSAEILERGGVPSKVEVFPKPVPFEKLQQMALSLRAQPGRAL